MPTLPTSTARLARPSSPIGRAARLALLAVGLAAAAGPVGCKSKAKPVDHPEQAIGPKPAPGLELPSATEPAPATGPAPATEAAPATQPAPGPIDASSPAVPATLPGGATTGGPAAEASPATQGVAATQGTPSGLLPPTHAAPGAPGTPGAPGAPAATFGPSGKPSPFPHGGVMANVTNPAFVPHPARGTLGTIDRLDPALDALLPADAAIEKIAEGFDWAEGPVYDKAGGRLFFSDVPQNVVYVWQEGRGLAEYLRPSGYTGTTPRGGEPGSNGLTIDNLGRLVLCQHGDRCVARLEGFQPKSATETWNPVFVPLVSKYNGKRFNSPNDLCFDSRGNLYFTDPPYGLVGNADDPAKELPNQGVFRLSNKGELVQVIGDMTRPNGIALSPDERTLYVANSDPDKAVWMAYPIDEEGKVGPGKVFFDATAMAKDQDANKGLPDGLKVDKQGNLWATGPGGVLVFSPAGKHLGTLRTGQATGNVAWGGADGSTLFICADGYVARVKTAAKGW